jgi:hypothetical protein
MAHYIAEQMAFAEHAKGEDKKAADERCFETILKLWRHRASYPDGTRPFERFEPIFRTLEAINSDQERPFYFVPQEQPATGRTKRKKSRDPGERWLSFARAIDAGAKVWLSTAFHYAALAATDEKTLAWVNAALDRDNALDISVIVALAPDTIDDEAETPAVKRTKLRKKLKSKVQTLDAFLEASTALRGELVKEIEATFATSPNKKRPAKRK